MSRLFKGRLICTLVFIMFLGSASIAFAAPSLQSSVTTPNATALHSAANHIDASGNRAQTARGGADIVIPDVAASSLQNPVMDTLIAVDGCKDHVCNLITRTIMALRDRRRGLAYGEVIGVGHDSLRIKTRNGELTVRIDETTHFRIPGTEEPDLEDVPVQATVVIAWLRQEDGTLLGRIVAVLPERPRRFLAVITGLSEDTLTLSLRSGRQIDVWTDENTRFLVPGVEDASTADLHTGETVVVQVAPPQNEETAYGAVVALLRDADGGWRVLRGELIAIDGSTLRIELPSTREVQLLTDVNTQFFVRGVDGATIADLSVGDKIGAQIVEREDGTLYASAVATGRARLRPRPGAVLGRIAAIDGETITLETRRGRIRVHTDTNTIFRLRGSDRPGIYDLRAGQVIGVVGHWEKDGSLHARIVGARTPHPNTRQGEPPSP